MSRTQKASRSLAWIFAVLPVHLAVADDAQMQVPLATVNQHPDTRVFEPDPGIENSDEDEVRRLFDLYIDARVAGTAEEADVLAKQIVQVSITSFGRDSKGTAKALVNLASLQVTHEENTAAIQNLTAAIDIVERVENNLSLDLIGPLNAMGAAQFQAGNEDLAKEAWFRAVHISHVNLGPHNYQQIETLQAIGQVYEADGKNKKAKKIRRRIKYLQSREVPPAADVLLPVASK